MTNLADPRTEGDAFTRGEAVAALLAGAWRRSPPPLRLTPVALEAILPLLAVGGAGGLAWRRLQETPLRTSHAGRELRQHYRLQMLRDTDREDAIRELLPRLRAVGVEPILIKGWSSARLYPGLGLRPSCDIDLCVSSDRFASAVAALSDRPLSVAVDLHAGVPDLPDRSWEDILRRSRLNALGDVPVRVLGPEDQLRLLCVHLARHGMSRPLWLCDVGACLESLSTGFDWYYCLHGHRHLTGWTVCVLGLAGRLFSLRIEEVGLRMPSNLPHWVERAVLWCWGAGPDGSLGRCLLDPVEFVRRLRYQGISPNHGSARIKAALRLGLGPDRWLPPLLPQFLGFLRFKIPYALHWLLRPRRCGERRLTLHT